ncbi:MAG TPA: hypothetical protein VFL76_10650 [Edaphocola sp.]|nr:hypothetical protein [Edaphocola sp.]
MEIAMDKEHVVRIYEMDEITFVNRKDKNIAVPLIKTDGLY